MNIRAITLPGLAAALVAGVLGVQVANGGGDFAPARAADPCQPRDVRSVSAGIDALGETLVLLALDHAACALGLTREGLVLRIAQAGQATEDEVAAVRAGLLGVVERLDREDRLPPVSDLADEALAEADLPAVAKAAIRAAPDSVLNNLLPTDDLLRRAVDELDLDRLLDDLVDPGQVDALIVAAVRDAAEDALLDRLRSLLP